MSRSLHASMSPTGQYSAATPPASRSAPMPLASTGQRTGPAAPVSVDASWVPDAPVRLRRARDLAQ